MYVPSPIPWVDGETLGEHLESRGVSRRQFLEFCGSLAAVLGLNSLMVPQLARALQSVRRPSVVWIQLQECTGCVESVLRTAEPTIGNLVLDLVSLDYSHTLMAAAGTAAERALQDSMRTREGIAFGTRIESDSATLVPLVERLREALAGDVHVLRDPTRGGLASAFNEIAAASGAGIELDEAAIGVPAEVSAACEMLGLDPLYVANEGVLTAIVPAAAREAALASLRSHPLGAAATYVGRVVREHPGLVVLRTSIGGTRIVDLLPGDQLPRIC